MVLEKYGTTMDMTSLPHPALLTSLTMLTGSKKILMKKVSPGTSLLITLLTMLLEIVPLIPPYGGRSALLKSISLRLTTKSTSETMSSFTDSESMRALNLLYTSR